MSIGENPPFGLATEIRDLIGAQTLAGLRETVT